MKSIRKRRNFKIIRTTSSRLKLKYSRRIRRQPRCGGAAGPAGPAHKKRIPVNDYIQMLKGDAAKSGFLTKRVDKFYGIFGHATSLPDLFKLNADLLFLTPYACSTQSTISPHFIDNVSSARYTLTRAYTSVYSSASASDGRGRNGETFLRFLDAMIHPMGAAAAAAAAAATQIRGWKTWGATPWDATPWDVGKYSETSVLRLHRPSEPGERIINTQVLASRPPELINGQFEGIIEFDLTRGSIRDVTGEFCLIPTTPADSGSAAAEKIQANTPYKIPAGRIPPYVWNTSDPKRRYRMITVQSLININPKYKNATFVSFGCRTAEPGVDPSTAETPKAYGQPSPDDSPELQQKRERGNPLS